MTTPTGPSGATGPSEDKPSVGRLPLDDYSLGNDDHQTGKHRFDDHSDTPEAESGSS